jgi:hypothetical protein
MKIIGLLWPKLDEKERSAIYFVSIILAYKANLLSKDEADRLLFFFIGWNFREMRPEEDWPSGVQKFWETIPFVINPAFDKIYQELLDRL